MDGLSLHDKFFGYRKCSCLVVDDALDSLNGLCINLWTNTAVRDIMGCIFDNLFMAQKGELMKYFYDLGAILSVMTALVAVGVGVFISSDPMYLWSLFLVAMMVNRFQVMQKEWLFGAGVIGLAANVLIAGTVWLTASPGFLWALFLVVAVLERFSFVSAEKRRLAVIIAMMILLLVGVAVYFTFAPACLWAILLVALIIDRV